jgi:hypothetical protein
LLAAMLKGQHQRLHFKYKVTNLSLATAPDL